MLYKLKKHVKLIIKSSTESHNASRAERQRIDQLLVQAEQLHADARSVGFVYVRLDLLPPTPWVTGI